MADDQLTAEELTNLVKREKTRAEFQLRSSDDFILGHDLQFYFKPGDMGEESAHDVEFLVTIQGLYIHSGWCRELKIVGQKPGVER